MREHMDRPFECGSVNSPIVYKLLYLPPRTHAAQRGGGGGTTLPLPRPGVCAGCRAREQLLGGTAGEAVSHGFFLINKSIKWNGSPAALSAEGAARRGGERRAQCAARPGGGSRAQRGRAGASRTPAPSAAAPRGGAAAAGDTAPRPGLPARRFLAGNPSPRHPHTCIELLKPPRFFFSNTFHWHGFILGRETNTRSLNATPNWRKLLILFENSAALQPQTP